MLYVNSGAKHITILTIGWKSAVLYETIDFLYPWVICGTQPSINLQFGSISLFWTDHDLG